MRNFTAFGFGMAALVALPVNAAARSGASCDPSLHGMASMIVAGMGQDVKEKAQDVRSLPSRSRSLISETAKRMKPGKVKTYEWMWDQWMPGETYEYTYDAAGNAIVELALDAEGDYARTVSEYNENGKLTFEETKVSSDGVEYQNNKKTEIEYDPILTNVITKRTDWMWMNGEWQAVGNCYRRIINRDESGNITSVVLAVLFDGIYDPTQRLTVTYGDDGTAIELSEQILDFDGKEYFWEQGDRITDIKWDRTDGQIFGIEDIFLGDNRIKSGIYEQDGMEFDLSVEYAEGNDGYEVTMSMTESGITVDAVTVYTPYANDGYLLEMSTRMFGTPIVTITEEIQNDDWGLMTLTRQKVESISGEFESLTAVGEVTYGAEGWPQEYTIRERYMDDSGADESDYVIKAEYSDYMDVTTGVGDVKAEEAVGRYYDLKGMSVAKPGKGVFIIDGKKILTR